MQILKRLNWQLIIIGVLTVAVVAVTCLPREISGENTVAGCKCQFHAGRACDSLEGRECHEGRNKCLGTGDKICYPDLAGANDCTRDHRNCKNQPDEFCA